MSAGGTRILVFPDIDKYWLLHDFANISGDATESGLLPQEIIGLRLASAIF